MADAKLTCFWICDPTTFTPRMLRVCIYLRVSCLKESMISYAGTLLARRGMARPTERDRKAYNS